ncbi:MAG: DUF72 domain-containing protein [Terriglobia bacterium]
MAELRVGTSGYNYKEWKGNFYPPKLSGHEMLRFYAQQLPSVEINYTFYRMPSERTLEGWAESVPEDFQFALKANQKITHGQKLRDCEATLQRFLEAAGVLASSGRLGPVLFQLPPSFRADWPVLEEFLQLRPRAFRFALEFRHPSWYGEKTYTLLRHYEAALCLAETEKEGPLDVLTAGFTYVRLRRPGYTEEELEGWRKRFQSWLQQGVDVYAYCKHEEAGRAPTYARRLLG